MTKRNYNRVVSPVVVQYVPKCRHYNVVAERGDICANCDWEQREYRSEPSYEETE